MGKFLLGVGVPVLVLGLTGGVEADDEMNDEMDDGTDVEAI